MSSPQTFAETTEHLEMLRVEDPKFSGQPHFLLVHTRVNGSRYEDEERTWWQGKFALRVEYFFGPLQEEIGKLVASMGGETHWNDTVRLSNGEVMIRIEALRSLGLGSFLFNRVVRWAKHLNPHSTVIPLFLSEVDGTNPTNRARRNRLYRRFGLRLNFKEEDEIHGHSASDMKVSELVELPQTNWPHVHASYWNIGWREFASQYKKTRRELRQARREARVFRAKVQRFEERIRIVTSYLRSVVSWPLAAFVGVLGFVLGSQRIPDWLLTLWHRLG